jgi:hypothetical protein
MSASFSTSIGIVRAFRDLGISLRFLSREAIKLLMLADMTFFPLGESDVRSSDDRAAIIGRSEKESLPLSSRSFGRRF